MSRTRVRWGRCAALLVGVGVLLGTLVQAVSAGPPTLGPSPRQSAAEGSTTYVVRPGDTLWSIARRVTGRRGDPRPVVARLIMANRVTDGLIHPGQVLVLRP